MGYLINNAYHQGRILKRAVPIDDVLSDEKINAEIKKKLILAQSAKKFAEEFLKLKKNKKLQHLRATGWPLRNLRGECRS